MSFPPFVINDVISRLLRVVLFVRRLGFTDSGFGPFASVSVGEWFSGVTSAPFVLRTGCMTEVFGASASSFMLPMVAGVGNASHSYSSLILTRVFLGTGTWWSPSEYL